MHCMYFFETIDKVFIDSSHYHVDWCVTSTHIQLKKLRINPFVTLFNIFYILISLIFPISIGSDF